MNHPHLKSIGSLALLAMHMAPAQAGAVPSIQSNLSVVISDDSGHSWDLTDTLTRMLDASLATGTVALIQPTSTLSADGGVWTPNASTTLTSGLTVTGLGWHSSQTVSGGAVSASNPWAVSMLVTHVSGDVDPTMDYGFYFKNNTSSTQNYAVTYGESIIPTLIGAYQIDASIAGGLANTDGSTTVASVPAGGLIQKVLLSSDGGATNVNAGVNVGPGVTQAGTSTYGPYSASTTGTAPGAGYNYWSFATLFSLTGNKDVFVASGSATITQIPEADARAMLLAGLAILGLMSACKRDQ